MGLGKTLCMLALVCFSLDHSEKRLSEEQDLRVSSTLIISPKSSMISPEMYLNLA